MIAVPSHAAADVVAWNASWEGSPYHSRELACTAKPFAGVAGGINSKGIVTLCRGAGKICAPRYRYTVSPSWNRSDTFPQVSHINLTPIGNTVGCSQLVHFSSKYRVLEYEGLIDSRKSAANSWAFRKMLSAFFTLSCCSANSPKYISADSKLIPKVSEISSALANVWATASLIKNAGAKTRA